MTERKSEEYRLQHVSSLFVVFNSSLALPPSSLLGAVAKGGVKPLPVLLPKLMHFP